MGVTRTSTRPVVGSDFILSYKNGVLITTPPEVQASLGKGDAVQRTTSYRTGRGVDGVVHDEDFELLSSKDYQGVRKALYSQYQRSKKSPMDNGHGFSTSKSWVEDVQQYSSSNMAGVDQYDYVGPITPSVMSSRFLVPTSFDATYYGTKAIAQTAPTAPSMSLLTMLTELRREGLPALPGMTSFQAKDFRSLGNEYLNWEFGFKPLAGDIVTAAETLLNSQKLLRQYRRDAGKQTRRRYSFPIERTTTAAAEVAGTAVHSGASSGIRPWVLTNGNAVTSVTGKLLMDTTIERRIYFSGAYMYHLPVSDNAFEDMERAARQAQKLLGIELTPETLWNLSPWTWLADWNFNIGNILTNISNFSSDSLVLRYGYVMCHTVTRRTYTLIKTQATRSGPEGPFMCSFVTEKKERVRASPYGFALNPSAYSGRQWAILGALGLTKAPTTLP